MHNHGRIAALLPAALLCLLCSLTTPPVAARQAGSTPSQRTTSQNTATVTVSVTGAKERKGTLNVYLFTHSDGFPTKMRAAYAVKRINLAELNSDTALQTLTATFGELAPGTYAVGVHHDKNGNNKMDSNFLGIPKEPVGCSNNVRPRMRAPHFDEAQFAVGAGEKKSLSIAVK